MIDRAGSGRQRTMTGAPRRRAVLAAALLLPLAGCVATPTATPTASTTTATTGSRTTPAPPTHAPITDDPELTALEQRFDARLGLFARHSGTGAELTHRPDERFAFCSAFKVLAAAALLDRVGLAGVDRMVRFDRDDLMASSVITRDRVGRGMTVREVCDAAVRHSDGTAGNLLLREIGGPTGLTDYARRLADPVTRMDRWEPDIISATPGDLRDTSSPRAFGSSFARIVLGSALPTPEREMLIDLLARNATQAGAERVRAGLPPGWTAADKTGTGRHATLVDVAVAWPPDGGAPLLVSVMADRADARAERDPTLLAAATARAVQLLVGP